MTPHGTRNRYNKGGCRCKRCTRANTDYQWLANMSRRIRATAEAPHGTRGAYTNWCCRCDLCVAVGIKHSTADRVSRLSRPEDIPHGTMSGYNNWGCRCDECRRAARAGWRATYKNRTKKS